MNKKNILLLLIFLSSSIHAIDSSKPLDSFIYKFYNTSNGLPQNSANSFSQNSKGFMYIATQEGFVKFDGIKMDTFDTTNVSRLNSDLVRKVIVDNNDNIFVATDKGLKYYAVTGELIENFTGPGKINNSDVSDISLSADGILYGVINGRGIFRIKICNPGTVHFFTPENGKISTGNINSIKVFRDGQVFAASRYGLFYLKNNKFVKISGNSDSFSSVARDSNRNIWATGTKGLYRIRQNRIVQHIGKDQGLPFKYLSAIFIDSSDTIWFGSSVNGIGTYRNGKFDSINKAGNTRFRNIMSIYEDNEKNIWIGTAIDGFSIIKEGCIVSSKLKDHLILGITHDTSGNIWANSLGKGAVKLTPDGKEHLINDVIGLDLFTILGDSNNRVWVSSRNRGIFISKDGEHFTYVKNYFSSPDDFPLNSSVFFEDSRKTVWTNDRDKKSTVFKFFGNTMKNYLLPVKNATVSDIVENSSGEILVGTRQNGIFRFDQVTGRFVKIKDIYHSKFFVHNMYFDSKNRLWISTHNNGILVYIDGDIINLKIENGLFDDNIHSIVEDKQHNFWFTTNKGIFTINSKEVKNFLSGDRTKVNPTILNESDGMPSRECNGGVKPSTMVSDNGNIWVPTIQGIVEINPLSAGKINAVAPLSFTWLVIDNDYKNKKRIFNTETINLAPKTKSLEIHYSSPAFSNPDNILFDYSLNSEHVVMGSKRKFASFNNLDPGTYKFMITAYTNNQKYSTYAKNELTFNIKTPIYLTENFRYASIALGILIFTLFFMMNKRVVRKREDEMLRTINEKTFELQLINKELQEAVVKDPLTGLKNRRFMYEFEENKILAFIDSKERSTHLLENRQESYRKESVYAILMLDIDYFKRVNDLYGHTTGDMVLVDFSKILKGAVRTDDIVIRWGGEEFLVLLKNIKRDKAMEIAEKIRKSIEKFPFRTENGRTIWITSSVGLTFVPFFDHAPNLVNLDNIISITDLALYNSKNKGRDRCTVVNAGKNIPSSTEQMLGMLASSQYAELNGFYIFERIASDNNEEFDLTEVK